MLAAPSSHGSRSDTKTGNCYCNSIEAAKYTETNLYRNTRTLLISTEDTSVTHRTRTDTHSQKETNKSAIPSTAGGKLPDERIIDEKPAAGPSAFLQPLISPGTPASLLVCSAATEFSLLPPHLLLSVCA